MSKRIEPTISQADSHLSLVPTEANPEAVAAEAVQAPEADNAMDEIAPVRRLRTASIPVAAPAIGAPPFQSRLLALIGSGNVGKSVIARLLAEWARAAGRPVGLADADRHHPTLSMFFADVMRPEDGLGDGAELSDAALKAWFEDVILGQLANKADAPSVIFDIGGGETTFARMAAELQLVEVLAAQEVVPIAVHVLGPRLQDLTDLQEMEEGAFKPRHTLLVINEGAMRGQPNVESAFGPIRRHRTYRNAVERGAVEIRLPALQCMGEVDRRRITFAQAALGKVKPGQTPLSPFDAGRVRSWLAQVEAAFAPVKAWLP